MFSSFPRISSSQSVGLVTNCGNHVVEFPEQCDDGNRFNGDGCTVGCRVEITSGGNFQSSGSSGNGDSSANSSARCSYSSASAASRSFTFSIPDSRMHTVCNNAVCIAVNGPGLSECYGKLGCGTEGHLICENSACTLVSGPGGNECGTSTDCVAYQFANQQNLVAAASLCGNGVLESLEECDDSNRRSNDGCNESCLLEIGICGDGIVQRLLDEQCEASTFDHSLPYDCVNCRFSSRSCGDGVLDPSEECDNGKSNSTSPNSVCRPDCSLSRCGDGVRDTGEECDDGNRMSDDGCDSSCRMEARSEQRSTGSSQSSTQAFVVAQQFQNLQFQNPYSQNINFPQYPNYQPLAYQLPLAQLQPIMMQTPHTTQTGPAAVAAIGAGAAAGFSWMRRRRK